MGSSTEIESFVITTGALSVSDTSESNSISTGCIVSSGGMSIAKKLYVGGLTNCVGKLLVTDTTQSSSSITGCTILSGGLGISKDTYIGGNLNIIGSITKGSGSFVIPHPIPQKRELGYKLRHCFVESNTAGDNIYRYKVEITNNKHVIQLPDYFFYLNENPQVWVRPENVFSKSYGNFSESTNSLNIYTERDGIFNILVIGTRKDSIALENWNKGEIFV